MKTIILVILMLVTGVTSCVDEIDKAGDYFFLRNEGSDMPVWVRGNTASSIFIIHLHGGPGDSSISEAESKAFYGLEEKYAMVYWDQRGSGATQGNPEPNTITLDQIVIDLEKLIELLNDRYKSPTFFLLGHSWGGAVGSAFLIKPGNQSRVRGWIELDGAHNFKMSLKLSRVWVMDYANQAIANNRDVSFWREALVWYGNHPVLSTKAILDVHAEKYLFKANGYIYDPNNPNLARFRSGKINGPGSILAGGEFVQEQLQSELTRGYSDQLGEVTIPALILWGRHDGILPVAMAQDAYDNLGTLPENKSIVIFENAAHSPNREEPELFNTSVIQFIETNR